MVNLYWSHSKVFKQKKQAEPTGDGSFWGVEMRPRSPELEVEKLTDYFCIFMAPWALKSGVRREGKSCFPRLPREIIVYESENSYLEDSEAHLKISHSGFRERFWIHFCLSTLQSKPLFKIKINHCLLYLASLLCVFKCYPSLKNFCLITEMSFMNIRQDKAIISL